MNTESANTSGLADKSRESLSVLTKKEREMSTTSLSQMARKFLVSIAVVFITVVVLPGTARAGTGTFEDGAFNFCVSLRFHASPDLIELIKTRFEEASQILSDATDGQHRFGTITTLTTVVHRVRQRCGSMQTMDEPTPLSGSTACAASTSTYTSF